MIEYDYEHYEELFCRTFYLAYFLKRLGIISEGVQNNVLHQQFIKVKGDQI